MPRPGSVWTCIPDIQSPFHVVITEAILACASVIILPRLTLCLVKCSRGSLAPVSLLLYLVCSRVSVSRSLFVYLFVHAELVRFLFYFDSPCFHVCHTGLWLSWLISGLCPPGVFSAPLPFLCSLSCPYTQAVLCVLLFLLFPVRFMPEFWVSCILKLQQYSCCFRVAAGLSHSNHASLPWPSLHLNLCIFDALPASINNH